MKHINIALFVPDEGCPHRCSFCNQKTISGKIKKLTLKDIDEAVKTAFECGKDIASAEIAFFGGSFTGIEREYMISLLQRAKHYIDIGQVSGIRISTRPDYINKEILDILSFYGVTSIELGCQSMDDEVLKMNNRGHTSADVKIACKLIKEHGFELGVQMMTGLYGDTDEKAIETCNELIALSPNTARIYPTVLLKDTYLYELYKMGEYTAQNLDNAVTLCSKLILMFHKASIPVIRVGLHAGGNVEEGFVSGPFHPAFRELCESRIYRNETLGLIKEKNIPEGRISVEVGRKYISMFVGQKKCNIEYLKNLGYLCTITQSDVLEKYKVIL